jgi:hypothetical protein
VNVHATVLDHHPIDHDSYDLLLVFKCQRGQWPVDAADEGLHVQVQLGRLGDCGLIVMPCLKAGRDVRPPLAKKFLAPPELIQRNQSGLIRVQQAMLLAV